MDATSLVDHLARNASALAAAAAEAGLDAPVPGTEWEVRALVTHVGGIHRWAADIVATRSSSPDTDAGRAVGSGPPDADLIDWFREGQLALVDTLRSAPADLECWTFLPAESPLHFWARRQAHETAIHRADAEGAAGKSTDFDLAFAQDGIAEMLHGFAARRSRTESEPGVIGLDVLDGPSWLIDLGGERIRAETSDHFGGVDFTVRGESSAIYRWLWNRPSVVEFEGERTLGRRWSETVRVRWS